MSSQDVSSRDTPPAKTRELQHPLMDSTRWDDFRLRDDDIVIATWGKSGTTWVQQIVGQLIFGGEDVNVAALSPWVDMRIVPQEAIDALEHQTHRRFLKTHLPVDALVFSPKAKYIYVARDGRDAAWSAYNHFLYWKQDLYDAVNTRPVRVGLPLERPRGTVYDYWREWFAGDGYPLWPYWEHIRGWWGIRSLPNVKLVHFNELKRDLPGSIRSIAEFLDIGIDEGRLPAILEHCSFDYMKAHASLVAPRGGANWEGGGATFIHKGTNGRWQDVLTPEECAAYEARAVAELGPDCAHWLKTGERP